MPLLAMASLGGCTTVQLVSNYDETIDQQALQLQKKLNVYLIAAQDAADGELKYSAQQAFYQGVLADLDAMEVRAAGIYRNGLTVEQIQLARQNLAYLVLLHKRCVEGPLTEAQRQAIRSNGVDLSLECRQDHGASRTVPNRGGQVLNRDALPPLRTMFNQQFGAIMALELAKKRGDRPRE